MKNILRFLVPMLALLAAPVRAHEFWIEPIAYQIGAGETISGNIHIGQEFNGSVFSYLPQSFVRFEVATSTGTHPVTGRLGDRPALSMTDMPEGLAVVVHETVDNVLTYTDPALFERFVTHKDALWVLESHAARGLPPKGFVETYRRYAKTLIRVGGGQGADAPQGLLYELVALANPYTDDLSGGMPVQLLHDSKPRADAQIELFAKSADGTVAVTFARTDADGIARLQVAPGTAYLVDSVLLEPREPSPETRDAVWHSLWASLVFSVPE